MYQYTTRIPSFNYFLKEDHTQTHTDTAKPRKPPRTEARRSGGWNIYIYMDPNHDELTTYRPPRIDQTTTQIVFFTAQSLEALFPKIRDIWVADKRHTTAQDVGWTGALFIWLKMGQQYMPIGWRLAVGWMDGCVAVGGLLWDERRSKMMGWKIRGTMKREQTKHTNTSVLVDLVGRVLQLLLGWVGSRQSDV